MNGVLWSVIVKHGYESTFPKLIQAQLKEKEITCQIYGADTKGQELVVLISLHTDYERKLFEDSMTFHFIKELMHQMCSFSEYSLADC